MNALLPEAIATSRSARPSSARFDDWDRCCDRWRRLMVSAQGGERRAYDELLRELEIWLLRYYARRLPQSVVEDAKQEALLAIHSRRHEYMSARPFGPWLAAIARHKWFDCLREATRLSTVSLNDDISTDDHPAAAAISAVAVDKLLRQLKPAQACVIRLVKLEGGSIESASGATGQSAALVKVNIHRGMNRIASIVSGPVDTPAIPATPRLETVGQ